MPALCRKHPKAVATNKMVSVTTGSRKAIMSIDLVDGERSALGPGRPMTVQWMKGRSRAYSSPSTAVAM
jgi:hypothetical protein